MGDVTPDQIATFDQALADVESNLDVLIDMWRMGDPDSPEHIRIAGLCVALGDSEWDRIAFVEILVAAIRRLDRAGQAATPDGPRRWALPDGAEVEEQWRVRSHWPNGDVTEAHYSKRGLAEIETYLRQVYSGCKVELFQRRTVITTPWELADATPAADGQDGDGRG